MEIEHIIVDLKKTAEKLEKEYPNLTKVTRKVGQEIVGYLIKGDQSNLGKAKTWLSGKDDEHPHEVVHMNS